MWALQKQWISHEINIRHTWQLKKSKSWVLFWSYQLNSTADLANFKKYKSDQTVFLQKGSPHGRIILAEGQFDHLYIIFWTMSILVFSPVANLIHHPLAPKMHPGFWFFQLPWMPIIHFMWNSLLLRRPHFWVYYFSLSHGVSIT